jgi:hypothetical protein
MKGVLPWLVRWAHRGVSRDYCPALAALDGPVQNICLLTTVHFFKIHLFPLPSKLGQAVCLGHLSLKGAKHEIFEIGFFTEIRPVRVGDLGTGEKR